MTDVSYDAGERRWFIPPSLANLPSPPAFLLRPGTRRDRRAYSKMLVKEGLQLHRPAALRAETIKGLQALWSPEIFEEYEGRIKSYWDAADQHGKEYEGADVVPLFEHPDKEAMDDLSRRITDSWQPLRAMVADIISFNADSPTVLLSLLVDSWKGIDVPFSRAEGVVSLDTLEAVEDALLAIERKAIAEKIAGVGEGLAFLQLRAEASGLLFLTKEQEKNSASPSLSTSTPPNSMTDGKAEEPGSSTASEPSTEALATS